MIRFLFKQPQPKRFDFKPRFYDERREQLHARVEAIRKEVEGTEGSNGGEVLRSRISRAWREQGTTTARRRSNSMVILLAGGLAALAYYYFYL